MKSLIRVSTAYLLLGEQCPNQLIWLSTSELWTRADRRKFCRRERRQWWRGFMTESPTVLTIHLRKITWFSAKRFTSTPCIRCVLHPNVNFFITAEWLRILITTSRMRNRFVIKIPVYEIFIMQNESPWRITHWSVRTTGSVMFLSSNAPVKWQSRPV